MQNKHSDNLTELSKKIEYVKDQNLESNQQTIKH